MTIKLKGSTDGSVSLSAPADTSPTGTDITLTLPTDAGSANQFLKNSGTAGTLDYSSMVEDSSGNVGIGTTSPTQQDGSGNQVLHIYEASAPAELRVQRGNGADAFFTARNDEAEIGTNNSKAFLIRTGDTERLRIETNGKVGIGTISPDRKLHVAGDWIRVDDGYGLDTSGSTEKVTLDNGYIALTTASLERMRIRSNGAFRLSTNTSDSDYYTDTGAFHVIHQNGESLAALIVEQSANTNPHGIAIDFSDASPDNNSQYFLRCLDVSGNRMYIWSDGDLDNHDNSYGAISDVKLKQDIVDAGSQWDDLKDLRVRKFKFKSDVAAYGDEAKTLIGLVAQEAETVSPGLVKESPDVDDDGNDLGTVTKSIRYSVLYMKAVKALQEAMDRIETLETKVAALEAA